MLADGLKAFFLFTPFTLSSLVQVLVIGKKRQMFAVKIEF